MSNQRNAQAAAAQREGASEDDAPLKTLYLETLQLVERLHRRLLDVAVSYTHLTLPTILLV